MKDLFIPEHELMDFEFYDLRNVPMHYHQNPELLYVLEGSLKIVLEEKDCLLQGRDFYIINANTRHALLSDAPVFYVCLHLNFIRLQHYLDMNRVIFLCDSNGMNDTLRQSISSLLDQIITNYFSRSGVSLIPLNSLYYSLLHQIAANCIAYTDDVRFETRKSVEQMRLNEIANYVYTNYKSDIRLADLAEQLYLSPAYLSKYIKTRLHMNFVDYVNSIRLYHAVAEIRNSEKKITNIAIDNGFSNLTAFNHAFKKFYDMTPSEFRAREKEKKQAGQAGALDAKIAKKAEDYLKNRSASVPEQTLSRQYLIADAHNQKIYSKYWKRMININRMSDLFQSDIQSHILLLKHELDFEYIRFWDIYSEELELNIGGNGDYYFEKMDRVMDFLIYHGIHPYIEIGFKPEMLVERLDQYLVAEHKEILFKTYAEAKYFFHSMISHYANRYGIAEIELWYFELWKDPRLLKEHDYQDYFTAFEACYDALKEISPNIRIGGGSIHMTFDEPIFAEFLSHWKQRIVNPDFLSIYSYPYYTGSAGRAIDRRRSQDTGYLKKTVETITDELARIGFHIKEVHVSEWNSSVSNRNLMNDSIWQGAYVMKNIIDNLGGISLLGYWLGSDLFSRHNYTNDILNGGVGLLTRSGIRKPSFYAFDFMNRMGNYIVAQYENALITSNGHNSFYIAVHNMKEPNLNYYRTPENELDPAQPENYFDQMDPIECNYQIRHVANGLYQIKVRRINAEYGSILDSWFAMGRFSELTPEDITYLDQISVPRVHIQENAVTDNILNFETVLEPNEIQMVHISYRYV